MFAYTMVNNGFDSFIYGPPVLSYIPQSQDGLPLAIKIAQNSPLFMPKSFYKFF